MGEYQLTKKERRALRRQERHNTQQHAARSVVMRQLLLWGGVLILVAATILGLVYLGGRTSGVGAHLFTDAVASSDWVKGNTDASVTLIEYGDFQCPACAVYHTFVKRLHEDMGDQVRIVYRHFPLRQIHSNADAAAWAAEAAGKQGKFWEMHDMLFERQSEWSNRRDVDDLFVSYAQELGLDGDQFRRDMDDRSIRDKVQNDYQSGVRAGVDGTPSFFLNGKKIQNPKNYDAFKQLIDSAAGGNS